MRARNLIVDACALLNLKAGNRVDAIREMVAALQEAGRLKDDAQCLKDVLARERQRTTGIGGGVAIPHACTAAVCQPLLAIGRSPEGLAFDAVDSEPVKLVFLLLVPKAAVSLHLRLLTWLARVLRYNGAVPELLAAASPAEALAVFEKREQTLGDFETTDGVPQVCVAGTGPADWPWPAICRCWAATSSCSTAARAGWSRSATWGAFVPAAKSPALRRFPWRRPIRPRPCPA